MNPHLIFSKKTKVIIGIIVSILLPCILILLAYFGYQSAFPQNERLVVSEIRLTGHSHYWNPTDPNENSKRRATIATTLSIEPGKTGMFAVNPKEYSGKLLEEIPSLASAEVYRELPDRLVFELQERIPIANLVGSDAYLDREGFVVSKSQYGDLTGTLPDIVMLAGKGGTIKYGPGDELAGNLSLKMVRDLIKITSQELSDIRITRFVVFVNNSSMDCTFLFREDATPFTVTFPDMQDTEKIKNDLLPRLLAVLRDPELTKKSHRFNFRWDGSVVIP